MLSVRGDFMSVAWMGRAVRRLAAPARADAVSGTIAWAENQVAVNPSGYYLPCLPFGTDAYASARVASSCQR